MSKWATFLQIIFTLPLIRIIDSHWCQMYLLNMLKYFTFDLNTYLVIKKKKSFTKYTISYTKSSNFVQQCIFLTIKCSFKKYILEAIAIKISTFLPFFIFFIFLDFAIFFEILWIKCIVNAIWYFFNEIWYLVRKFMSP